MLVQLTQRQIHLGLFILMTFGTLMLTILVFTSPSAQIISKIVAGGLFLCFGGLLLAYRRGWEYARPIAVVAITILMGVGIPASNPDNITQQITWAVLLPPIVALLLTEPGWVLGSGITILAIVIARAGGRGVYTSPIELTLYIVVIGGMVLSRLATDAAERIAAANERAEAALRLSEQREADLARSNVDLQRLVDEVRRRETEQARLLAENSQQRDAIRELSVPVLPIQRGTLAMPLIGALDSTRLRDLQERALQAIQRTSAQRLLLDITGVPIVDSQVAQGLIGVVQAARLLGTEVLLVGIRPEVAQTIVGLGLDLREVRTYSDIQTALDTNEQPSDRRAVSSRRDLRDPLV
jgi:rsbT co-antagonist protein RsbR